MEKYLVIFFLVFCFISLNCTDNKQGLENKKSSESLEKPKVIDVTRVLNSVSELSEEKMFFVTLKFKKEQLTLDPFELAGNELKATTQTIIVGEKTYNEYRIGQQISNVADTWGFVFDGEFSSYTITVNEKKTESQCFWTDTTGRQVEISKEEYDAALMQVINKKQSLTVPFSGIIKTYVLKKPLNTYTFSSYQPLQHYFLEVKVENQTLTFDIAKHIRNAANTHLIVFEVSEDGYKNSGEIWEPKLNTASFFLKGNLSKLMGVIMKRWTEPENKYQIGITPDGKHMIIPK